MGQYLPSQVEQSVEEQVQVRKGLPLLLYHTTWWIQFVFVSLTLSQALPSLPDVVRDMLARSRSIACAAV